MKKELLKTGTFIIIFYLATLFAYTAYNYYNALTNNNVAQNYSVDYNEVE